MSFIWETPEEINFALAQRLRRIRKRKNLTQQQLSEKSNPFLDGNGRIGRIFVIRYYCFSHYAIIAASVIMVFEEKQ